MLLSNSAAVHVSHCTFSSNGALMNGGAIHIEFQQMSNVLINSCFFVKNAADQGGAMYSMQGNSVEFVLKNCTFRENVASQIGGALVFLETSAKIVDSKFSNNTSPLTCAVCFNGSKNEMHIERSFFWRHIPLPVNNYGTPTIVFVWATKKFFARDLIFEENTSDGTLALFNAHGAEVHNSFFHRNSGKAGSALQAVNTSLHIQNSSFVGNIASKGAVVTVADTNCLVDLQSCRFAANTCSSPSPMGIYATQHIEVRSCNNVFVEHPLQQNHYEMELMSLSLDNITAKVYFWQNMYEFSSNKTTLIDGNFLNNLSLPKVFSVQRVNMTVKFSQFASGEFDIVHTSISSFLRLSVS